MGNAFKEIIRSFSVVSFKFYNFPLFLPILTPVPRWMLEQRWDMEEVELMRNHLVRLGTPRFTDEGHNHMVVCVENPRCGMGGKNTRCCLKAGE